MAIGAGAARGTAIAGTGNNQDIAVTIATASINVGEVAIIFVSKTGQTSLTGVSDSKGNNWKFLGQFKNVTNANIMVEAWVCRVATQLVLSTDTVTATWGVNENDICAALRRWTVAAGKTLAQTGQAAAVGNEVNGVNGFGSVSFSSLTSLSRLYLRVAGKQANTTTAITVSTSFTSWGLTLRSRNNAAASIARAEERINTSTGETSNPTLAVSGNTAGLFFALEEVDASNSVVLEGGGARGSFRGAFRGGL